YAPTEEKAHAHGFYAWMLAGQELYSALAHTDCTVVETFPQAVACALSGKVVSAKEKRSIRRALLSKVGFPVVELSNIDELDASLCAIAAQSFACEHFKTYGDQTGGFIIVPDPSLTTVGAVCDRARFVESTRNGRSAKRKRDSAQQ